MESTNLLLLLDNKTLKALHNQLNIGEYNMKKILITLAIAVTFAACVDKEETKQISTENLSPIKEKTAPIKEGYRTIITADGDTICSAVKAIPYFLPKGTTEQITYVPLTKGYENQGIYSSSENRFILCFEDTKSGDNDYNDFACAMTINRTNDYGSHCILN